MKETASAPPNIAVIGMGYWGKNLVRNFYELGALKTVCDADETRRAALEEKCPGLEFTSSYDDILSDDAIQGIVLATPAATHFDMARHAIEAGKDVFVEKPLALTVKNGEHLVRLAADRQRILMVGHILRYHPAVVQLDKMIRDGELGRIQYFSSSRLNMGKIRTEENILWSFAPHDISVMLALLGEEPCEINCQGGAYLDRKIADVTMSQFLFPSGVRAHIYVSWLHPFKEQKLIVVGSEQMAVFDDTADQKLVVYPHRIEWKNRVPTAIKAEAQAIEVDAGEPLRAECRHFLDCIRDRRQPVTDGQEGLRVLKVLSACQSSLESARAETAVTADAGAPEKDYFVHNTAFADEGCQIGTGTKVWHFAHVMKGARIGERCIVGQNCNIASDVVIGNNVKIQNNVSIYTGTIVEDDVFLGPSCVLTNVTNPRSQINRHSLYEKTLIRRGATIGANATIVCGITIGRYAFVSAGAVVTRDLPDYALVMGCPSRQAGWMSRHGHRLSDSDDDGVMVCPESGYRYKEASPGVLRCLDIDEETPLPEEQAAGERTYDSFKSGPVKS